MWASTAVICRLLLSDTEAELAATSVRSRALTSNGEVPRSGRRAAAHQEHTWESVYLMVVECGRNFIHFHKKLGVLDTGRILRQWTSAMGPGWRQHVSDGRGSWSAGFGEHWQRDCWLKVGRVLPLGTADLADLLPD